MNLEDLGILIFSLMLIFESYAIYKNPMEVFSLRFIFVFIYWLGYHCNTWVYRLMGEIFADKIAVSADIPTVLFYTSIFTLFVFIGYGFKNFYYKIEFNEKYWDVRIYSILIFSILIVIFNRTGFDNFWISTVSLGEDRGVQHGSLERLFSIFSTFLVPTICGFYGCYIWVLGLVKRRKRLIVLGFIAIILSIMPSAYSFSRASGFMLFMAAMFLSFTDYKRKNILMVILVISGIYLGYVGFLKRGGFGYGLFINACFTPFDKIDISDFNITDFTGPVTRYIAFYDIRGVSKGAYFDFLININPLPSLFLTSTNASIDMGEILKASGGVTTQTIAEIFVLFKYWALLGAFSFGYFLRKIDSQLVDKKNMFFVFAKITAIACIGFSVHSNCRTSSRMFWLAFFSLIFGNYFFNKKLKVAYNDK